MKKLTLILLPALFLAACSQSHSDDLASLREEKDSLKAVQKEVTKRIAEIDAVISENVDEKDLMQVTTMNLKADDFAHYIEVYGNVESAKNIIIYPEVAAVIEKITIEEGEEVKAGQLLMKLDSDVLQSNLAEVETNLELATTLFEKQKKLWEKNIGSEVQYLEAKNRKESLESTRNTLRSQLSMTNVTAPFDGIIDEVFPKVGEMANPQMPAIRLVNLSDIYIKADVSETYIGSVKNGSFARIEIPSLKLDVVSKVNQVGQYINPNNRTFKVRVNIPDTLRANIKPNLLAKLKIKDFEVKGSALTVPNRMIQQTPDGEDYVMLIKKEGGDNKVIKQMIKTGISYAGNTLIQEGLQEGDLLVDKGARSINAGQEVAIVE